MASTHMGRIRDHRCCVDGALVTIPISLLVAHFVGDFLLQTDWMALNKSKNWWALGVHCLVYSLCFWFLGPTFVIATFCFHFLTDAITSRITGKLWFIPMEPMVVPFEVEPKHTHYCHILPTRYWFFVMIGFDQLIHYVTLALTLRMLS